MGKVCLAVVGASGRMGQEVVNLAKASKDFDLKAQVSRSGSIKSLNDVNQKIDVAIDFSLKENFKPTLSWCVSNNVKLVSGVTGLTSDDMKALNLASEQLPCLWSSNMSLGINLMAKMLVDLSSLKNHELQLVETHHKNKKDSPSGTALFLQDILEKNASKVHQPISIRGGGVFGIHEVLSMGEDEVIKLQHTALNRKVFAKGALAAAKWINSIKVPKLYSIKDVLS